MEKKNQVQDLQKGNDIVKAKSVLFDNGLFPMYF